MRGRASRAAALLILLMLGITQQGSAQAAAASATPADTTQHAAAAKPTGAGKPAAKDNSAAPAPSVANASPPAAAQAAAKKEAVATPAGARPRIVALYQAGDRAQDSVFALDSYLTLEVAGLVPYLRRNEALLRAQGLTPEQARAKANAFILYINDAPLVGLGPQSAYNLPVTSTDTLTKLIFHLTRSPSTYPYWSVVYSSPWQFMHPGKIGLGYPDRVITDIYPLEGQPVRIKLIRPLALYVGFAAVALLAFAILRLGSRSRMLRDSVPGIEVPPGHQLEFSLAKCQLAWWTFLVLSGYLLVYCVTGTMPTISTTTLALLGVSAGTAGLSSALSKAPGTVSQAANGRVMPYFSRGWWTDIVSDDQGVSMHRLQQVGFTLLMGYLFVRTVYKTVALPEWTDNEILLLALSSATYLGLKSQEGTGSGALPAPQAAPQVEVNVTPTVLTNSPASRQAAVVVPVIPTSAAEAVSAPVAAAPAAVTGVGEGSAPASAAPAPASAVTVKPETTSPAEPVTPPVTPEKTSPVLAVHPTVDPSSASLHSSSDNPDTTHALANKLKVDAAGRAFITREEGEVLQAYKCQAGVDTIGVGHTHGVKPGMTITKDQSQAFLSEDLAEFEAAVNRYITMPLNQNQFNALVSFAFNLGAGALERSTLRSEINAQHGKDAAVVVPLFTEYCNVLGRPDESIKARRHREAVLFLS